MKTQTDITVIIVSYNTEKLTDTCLKTLYHSIRKSPLNVEVIVVDNVSQDGTRAMLKKKYPQVKTILNKTNAGFGKANNQGMKMASGGHIFLLNSDTETYDGAVDALYECAKRHPDMFIGGKLYNTDRTPQPSAGPFFTLPVVFVSLFLRGDRIGLTRYSPDSSRQVGWLSGACIFASKKLFFDGLLFDEQIFMYMEEVDLLYRAKCKGFRTYFCREAEFIHVGGGSSTTYRKQPVLNIYKGLLFFYRKHYSSGELTFLKLMLKMKAILAVLFGKIMGKPHIIETYEEAYRLV